MKTIEEIKKLNTKNLLRYYRAERKRMFEKGYKYTIVGETEMGDAIIGWDSCSNLNTFDEDVTHLYKIKTELNTREHIK